jgi:replication factor C small subunit
MDIFNSLWIEKYRPAILGDLVLSKENLDTFNVYRKEQNIPNLLFVGNPGTGKSTLAKVTVKDILDCQYMYINASDESGIDTIRNKVIGFAQTKSIDGKIKVIILDEADGISGDGQRALRNVMEEYSQISRFILTANFRSRIILPLQSRCQIFDLVPPIENIITRLKFILDTEKIKYNINDIEQISRENYPDLRKCISQIQRYSKNANLLLPIKAEVNDFIESLFKLLQNGHVLKIRKWVIESEIKFGNDYPFLLKQLFDYVYIQKLDSDCKKQLLIIIAEYLWRNSQVLDQEINAYACFLQINEVLIKK